MDALNVDPARASKPWLKVISFAAFKSALAPHFMVREGPAVIVLVASKLYCSPALTVMSLNSYISRPDPKLLIFIPGVENPRLNSKAPPGQKLVNAYMFDIMSQVVCGVQVSVNAAFQSMEEEV